MARQPHPSLWGLTLAGAGGTREGGTMFCKAPPHPYQLGVPGGGGVGRSMGWVGMRVLIPGPGLWVSTTWLKLDWPSAETAAGLF